MPNKVARKEMTSIHGWWFRFADDEEAKPPELWGNKLRQATLVEQRGRYVIGVNLATGEQQRFRTVAVAAQAIGVEYSTVYEVASGGRTPLRAGGSALRMSRARCRSRGEQRQCERNETAACSQ
jgi:hypothetical protein